MFMWVFVYRPVKELIAARTAWRTATSSTACRSVPTTNWATSAASFNKMTAEVAGVQAHIEEQVRRKTAELERVHKTLLGSEKMASIGKLAATVAHEINNPLFGILTYARLVLRELLKHEVPGRDEMAEQLQTIERESKRCGELVKNLLTFSRQAPSHREPNDLNTVVHRAVLLVKHKLEMQNIELVETLAPDLPPVDCDANQIQQVVLVLMVNASEAMPKGGRAGSLDGARRRAGAGRGAGQGYGKRHPGRRAAADFRSVFHDQGGPEPDRPRAWRWRTASWSSTRAISRCAPRRAKERNFVSAGCRVAAAVEAGIKPGARRRSIDAQQEELWQLR